MMPVKPSGRNTPAVSRERALRTRAFWRARRAGKARWGPVTPAQRLIWRDKDL